MNPKVHVPCNFICFIETEGPLKVLGSYVHCKSGNISEMVSIE